jgi:transketolase
MNELPFCTDCGGRVSVVASLGKDDLNRVVSLYGSPDNDSGSASPTSRTIQYANAGVHFTFTSDKAASAGLHFGLDNLCLVIDVNGLGQSQATQLDHDTKGIADRWTSFGWHAIQVDGHDVQQLLDAYEVARKTTGRPTVIVARTLKGKGVESVAGKDGWHGKAFKKDEAEKAIAEIEAQMTSGVSKPEIRKPEGNGRPPATPADDSKMPAPAYKMGDLVATREAWGTGLASLGGVDPRVVALDADVKNSTCSDRFEKLHADRFFEFFIAVQRLPACASDLPFSELQSMSGLWSEFFASTPLQ